MARGQLQQSLGVIDGGQSAGDGSLAKCCADLSDPGLGGDRVGELDQRPGPGDQERVQIGGIVHLSGGDPGSFAERRGVRPAPVQESLLCQTPQRRQDARDFPHPLADLDRLIERVHRIQAEAASQS